MKDGSELMEFSYEIIEFDEVISSYRGNDYEFCSSI